MGVLAALHDPMPQRGELPFQVEDIRHAMVWGVLHDIFEPDADRDPHNHPWSFISIVLRGRYEEKVHYEPEQEMSGVSPAHPITKKHGRFSIHRMDGEAAHRITYAAPGLKTLIIRGPRKPKGWGFFTRDGYVPWQKYGRDGVKT
jgi:hypothetical protein